MLSRKETLIFVLSQVGIDGLMFIFVREESMSSDGIIMGSSGAEVASFGVDFGLCVWVSSNGIIWGELLDVV